MKLVAKQHKVLVYAIVVYLVPVQVEDVEKVLKPELLVCDSAFIVSCRNQGEELADLLSYLMLVNWLVRVPEG